MGTEAERSCPWNWILPRSISQVASGPSLATLPRGSCTLPTGDPSRQQGTGARDRALRMSAPTSRASGSIQTSNVQNEEMSPKGELGWRRERNGRLEAAGVLGEAPALPVWACHGHLAPTGRAIRGPACSRRNIPRPGPAPAVPMEHIPFPADGSATRRGEPGPSALYPTVRKPQIRNDPCLSHPGPWRGSVSTGRRRRRYPQPCPAPSPDEQQVPCRPHPAGHSSPPSQTTTTAADAGAGISRLYFILDVALSPFQLPTTPGAGTDCALLPTIQTRKLRLGGHMAGRRSQSLHAMEPRPIPRPASTLQGPEMATRAGVEGGAV